MLSLESKQAQWLPQREPSSAIDSAIEMISMQPLENLKVLDFCWVAAGPMTTGYLAEYGATVVRVESRQRPDPLHTSPPLAPGKGLNRSGYYGSYSANKYALGLNLGSPKAIQVVKRMAGV